MRLKLLILTFLLVSTCSFAQKIGTWDVHFSYSNEVDTIIQAKDKIYVLTDGKLYSYSPEDDYYETYIKMDRGNPNIVKVGYNEKNDVLVIFREDYNIDLLYSNGSFTTISYLKDATQNIDKTIRDIYCVDDLAYLSTNFGLLILNVAKEEVKEVGLFNKKFFSSCIFGDYLYAASEMGVMRVLLTQNIQDINNWEKFDVLSRCDEQDFLESNIVKLFLFRDRLCLFVESERIYGWNTDTDRMEAIDLWGPVRLEYITNDKLVLSRWGTVVVYDSKSSFYFMIPQNTDLTNQAIIPKKGTADEYWIGIPKHSLSQIKRVGESYEMLGDFKIPSGPWNNTPFSMFHDGNRLLVTGGGYYYGSNGTPGYLSYYKNGSWNLFDNAQVNSKFGVNALDYNAVIVDPSNKSRMFITSWRDGLYEFLNDEPQAFYNPTNTGGVLEDIYGGSSYVRLGGMSFDKSGNLWMTNALVSAPIKVLQKDGTWTAVKHSEISVPKAEVENTTSARGVMIDRYDKKWIYSMFKSPYIFILDDNKTPSDILDDKKKLVSSFVDQDNKTLSIEIFYDLKEDQNGNIWVASNAGPYIIYGSSSTLSTSNISKNVVFNKIKIPRNDGTNNVDILLEGTDIKAIAVDGANRKWLGTPYGVYLVSDNGLETIHYFNMDNSPLPSNEIISLAIDPDNGTVYIGTDKGLVSYVSDAIDGKADYSDVYAFPNPVRPDYQGVITITGLQTNTNVKITDVRGNILKQGLSLGGQFVWDGRNPSGKRVDTGVYLVFGATSDGKSGVVTKILVVN